MSDFSDDFPGLIGRMLNTRLSGRIGHAYLLIGDDAPFLERFANAWAQVCACLHPSPVGDACGDCAPCKLFESANYPERRELRPQSKSRRIVVDEVRQFERDLSLASPRDRLKLGVIVDSECMGPEAQNAFLKTLEEPPPRTLLLLLSAQPRLLLPTIRSRCQTVSLLRNRRDYGLPLELGLFPVLASLREGSGAKVGLMAAAKLEAILGTLREQAEAKLDGDHDERWAAVAEDDRTLARKLSEQHGARIEAEYVRLRQGVLDAIQAWFQQQALRAANADPKLLPHPELLASAQEGKADLTPPAWTEADRAVRETNALLRHLRSNVQEGLALAAFCLELARVRRSPRQR